MAWRASLLFSFVMLVAGCKLAPCDLANKVIDVTVVERYDASSQFQYVQFIPYVDPPCTGLPDPPATLSFLTGNNVGRAGRQCLITAQLAATAASIVWFSFDHVPSAEEYETNQAILHSAVFAQGSLTLSDGCSGTYTLALYPQGVFVSGEADYLQTPVPGERPPWVLDRIFQPQTGCSASGFPSRCSDTWAAYATAVTSR